MSFVCAKCETELFAFVPNRNPPEAWEYDAQTDEWTCDMCSSTEDRIRSAERAVTTIVAMCAFCAGAAVGFIIGFLVVALAGVPGA